MAPNPKRMKLEGIVLDEVEVIYTGAGSEDEDEVTREYLRNLRCIEKQNRNAQLHHDVKPKIEVKGETLNVLEQNSVNWRDEMNELLNDIDRRMKIIKDARESSGLQFDQEFKEEFTAKVNSRIDINFEQFQVIRLSNDKKNEQGSTGTLQSSTNEAESNAQNTVVCGETDDESDGDETIYYMSSDSESDSESNAIDQDRVPLNQITHPRLVNGNTETPADRREISFECFDCKKVFTSERDLQQHQTIHIKCFKCSHCNKAFTHSHFKKRHERACKSNLNADLLKKQVEFKCNECKKTFGRKDVLTRHQLIHDGTKRFKCSHCDKTFTESSSRKRHERICKSNPNADSLKEQMGFECDQCKKKFSRKDALNSHKLIHDSIKRFKCSHCDVALTYSYGLKRHERTCRYNQNASSLKEQEEFECNQCNKKFSRKDALKSHKLIHDSIKRFKCSHCNMAFTYSHGLRRHERTCKSK